MHREQLVAQSRMIELWLTEPTPRRKIHACVLETVQILRQRLAKELELPEKCWSLLDLEFSGNVLSPEFKAHWHWSRRGSRRCVVAVHAKLM